VVPLPFVASQHADGSLLGVALILPREASDESRRSLLRALARWESAQRRQDEEVPVLPILLGRAGSMLVTRVEDLPRQQSLRSATWCEASRRWASASPIALDRNPGDLWARDQQKAGGAVAEATAGIRLACQHIGLPAPVDVTILPSPALVGAAKSRQFAPFPEGAGRVQRVLTHAAVEFAEPVTGPVLLGAGRYLGLGLMRPVNHE
jgi:CRISPR-associated protein Csb2